MPLVRSTIISPKNRFLDDLIPRKLSPGRSVRLHTRMPSSPSARILLCLAIASVFLLSGCGGNRAEITGLLERAESFPLWQRITAVSLATLVSEDLACIAAGMLASEGVLTVGWAILASFLGIFFGDVLLYFLGRIGGIALLRRVPFRWVIREDRIVQAENLFREHGAKLIFSSRLLPGSRLPIYAAAGVLGYPLWRFALFMALAGALSAITLVGISFRLGEVVFDWLEIYESYALPILISAVILVWIGVKLFEILATRRSRLVFLARLRRVYNHFLGKPPRS